MVSAARLTGPRGPGSHRGQRGVRLRRQIDVDRVARPDRATALDDRHHPGAPGAWRCNWRRRCRAATCARRLLAGFSIGPIAWRALHEKRPEQEWLSSGALLLIRRARTTVAVQQFGGGKKEQGEEDRERENGRQNKGRSKSDINLFRLGPMCQLGGRLFGLPVGVCCARATAGRA